MMLRTLRARPTRYRVRCRDDRGRRGLLWTVPRPDGAGVLPRSALGDLLLSPLEVGRLRTLLAEAVLASETTDTAGPA